MIENELKYLRRQLDTNKQTFLEARDRIRRESSREQEYLTRLERLAKAKEVLQTVARLVQEEIQSQIGSTVTTCLQTVFPDEDYECVLEFEIKAGRTQVKPVLVHNEHIIESPLEEDSGGVVDVGAFMLQAVCIFLKKPPIAKIMILDEPFKFVSIEYRDNVRKMLHMLAREFKVQIIMVTHIKELVTGTVVYL